MNGKKIIAKSNFTLQLQPSILDDARRLAGEVGVALDQFVNMAVAEHVSALRRESYLAERASRADILKALRVLKHAGAGRPPVKGDGAPEIRRKRRQTG